VPSQYPSCLAFTSCCFPVGPAPLGVMIFFVLSGFLVTRILLREFSRSGNISLPKFYQRRALRIFPVFYFCWILELALIRIHGVSLASWEPWVSFFYLTDYARALLGIDGIQHMNIAWSLAIEEQFYLLWPVILLFLLRRNLDVFSILCWVIGGVWLWRAVLFLQFSVKWDYIYNAPDTRIDSLLIGACVALLAQDAHRIQWLNRISTTPWWSALPLTVLGLSWGCDRIIERNATLAVINFTLQPVLIAILLIHAVRFGSSQWRVLAHPAFAFVARTSYSLYLFHALVLGERGRFLLPTGLHYVLGLGLADREGHVRLAAAVIPALVLSVCSYYFLETPLMRLRDIQKAPAMLTDPAKV
jgi:peptidoglycan/LPS O-acetylase OafA/YrhL